MTAHTAQARPAGHRAWWWLLLAGGFEIGWTGTGAVGTVLVGAIAFDDPLGPVRVLLLSGLVAAMVGIQLVGGAKRAA